MNLVFPAVGSVWRNIKHQTLYKVLYAGSHTETGEPLVVYQGIGDNTPADPDDVWCRPLAMWRDKFEELPDLPKDPEKFILDVLNKYGVLSAEDLKESLLREGIEGHSSSLWKLAEEGKVYFDNDWRLRLKCQTSQPQFKQ